MTRRLDDEVHDTDLSVKDLARLVGRHPETLRRLARRGRLAGAYRLGGRWGICREAADRLRGVPRRNEPERETRRRRAVST